MAELDAHADAVAAFYRRLKEAEVDEQVAGVLAIDLSKAILAGTVVVPQDDQKARLREVARAKAERRAEQIAKGQ